MEPSLKVGEHCLNITVYVSCPLATSYDHIWLYPKKRRESSYLARVSINMCEFGLLLSISSDCFSSDQVTLSSKLPSTPSRTCLRILVGIIPFSVFLVSCLGHVPPLTMAWVCGCPPLIVLLFLYTCVAVPEIDRKRLSTEPFMATYLNTFLSTLLVIPVSATQECLPLF